MTRVRDERVGGVPVRAYEPSTAPWATLVWAHGGSFVRGTLDWPEADWVAHRFAESGMRVFSVDYRLASETVKAPAPAHDVAAVVREALAESEVPVLVGGASAGAHLAVAAALDLATEVAGPTDAHRVRGLVLIYPTLHRVQRDRPDIAALTARLPEARRFGRERIAEMYDFYLGDTDTRPVGEEPAERLAALPKTAMVHADADDLRASGEQFAEQLEAAGVQVIQHVQPDTVHGYMNRPEESGRARRDAHATIEVLVGGAAGILGLNPPSPSHQPAVTQEPGLRAPVTLTSPDGTLNREAVGWATQPIVDTSGLGRGRGRNKRWEYWNIATPDHVLALTVSHIDYACVHEVWVLERATGRTWGTSATVLPPRGAVLAPRLEHGRSMARAKNLAIDIDEMAGGTREAGTREAGTREAGRGTRLRAQIPGVQFDVVAALPEGHERLAVVVPWGDTRFQYTVKDLARPATGWVEIGGTRHLLPKGESWAVLDHGRGRWPYDITWNWGAGSGRSGGRVIGVQVGGKWTAGTGVSENAFFVDGRMHKIHGETEWRYDLDNWRQPWSVRGGGLDAVFEPLHNKVTRTDLLVLQNHTDQCFGHWSGTFETSDGELVDFDGIFGWAEHVHNRW